MLRPKIINVICLLAAMIFVLVLPFKKEIWYDETISISISKGITYDTPALYANAKTVSSAEIAQLNTAANVFSATVDDNGNSFLYNILLHWFTMLFGNTVATYMLFSKLCAIAVLLVFFAWCNLLFKDSLFTALAILLLATNSIFTGMSHEIRGYEMGMFFIVLAAFYLYRFLYQHGNAVHLFFAGLFAVCALLSHFLTVYVILVFAVVLVYEKKGALFTIKNLAMMLVPLTILALFFYKAYPGLQTMSRQNAGILQRHIHDPFSIWQVCIRSLMYAAIDFKMVFPAFANRAVIILLSFAVVPLLYFFGIKYADNKSEKRNLHLLFILGISGTIFQAFLSIKSHHYTAIYYRYYSFCMPFCTLFVAYALYILYKSRIAGVIKAGAITAFALPACVLTLLSLRSRPQILYNHPVVAREIIHDNITKVGVPEWQDALLLQCLLPKGSSINYTLNPNLPNFILYKANTTEQIPVVKQKS